MGYPDVNPGNDPAQRFQRAWEYHKDGDSLLHSRMSSFSVSQSFMTGAFAASHSANLTSYPYIDKFQWALIAVGVIYALGFMIIGICMVRRLNRIKSNILLASDEIYQLYLTGIDMSTSQPSISIYNSHEGFISYVIPLAAPLTILVFWFFVSLIRVNVI